tara:strand:+ start:1006 stop:1299 length:294 start_codon:yes stop_codon:yes gene_type:complete
MSSNTKIKFFLRIIRSTSILSISAVIYIFCLNYLEIIKSFQSQEYLIWINCSREARSKAFNNSLLEGWDSSVLIDKLDEYETKDCSSQPKRWKFQRK